MDNILLYIINEETRSSWNRAIEMSDRFDATLYGLYIIDEHNVKRVAKLRGEDPVDTAIDMEEEGWKLLYHLEDMAINDGVKSNLSVEEGDPINTIRSQVRKNDIDMLIVGYKIADKSAQRKTERFMNQLVKHIQCPILIDKEGDK